ncbi:MAG TPA: extracellular solute-binding protein, partial [Chloroflexota bacterium]|nr:extracellular solute-binding protein [Chloroflexota bacterium]
TAAAAAAACGRSDAGSVSRPPARVRVLARTEYDGPAWQVFNEASTTVQVDVEQVAGNVALEQGGISTRDYGAKVLAMVAADAAPDVVYTHANFFSSLASLKALADVEKLAAGTKFDLKGIQQELLDSNRWNGVLSALPYSGVANVVVFNAGQFQKRGVTLPPEQVRAGRWTWEGFRQSLQQLTVRQPGQPAEVGMPQHFSGLVYISQWIFGAGGQVWSKDLKTAVLDSRESTAAVEFLAGLHHKDRVAIQPEERAEFGDNAQEGFPTGRVALRFRATTELHFYRQMAEEGARLGVAPVPSGPAGTTPRGAANSWGIWSHSKAPEAAWYAATAWHADPVLKFLFANRYIFPCRQAQFEHAAFRAALFPWEDLETERAALRDVRIVATPARFTEIDELWLRLWPAARDGRRSIGDLLGEFLPQATSLLR